MPQRKAAQRPETRTIEIKLTGAFEGWEATAKGDFPARLLGELQSDSVNQIIHVLDEIIVEHNFPNSAGEIAETMGDVDPYQGLLDAGGAIFDAIGHLPSR